MIKEEKRLEAVHHARKYFSTSESDQMDDIQKVMALLGKDGRSCQNQLLKTALPTHCIW